MTTKEAWRYQMSALKEKTLKQKLEHIVTYYWLPIVAVLVLLSLGVSYAVHLATRKEVALNVTCINGLAEETKTAQYAERFAQAAGIDLKQFEVTISTGKLHTDEGWEGYYESVEAVAVMLAAQEMDMMAADLESLYQYFYLDIFADLTAVLSAEQQKNYGEYFLYVDLAVLEQVRNETELEKLPAFPDPEKPEEMEKPVPVAIRLPAGGEFTQLCFSHCKDSAAVGIVVNTKNLANALAFLDDIME